MTHLWSFAKALLTNSFQEKPLTLYLQDFWNCSLVKILIKIPDEKLRSCGISYSKIKYLKDLSKKVSSGFLKFDQFDQLDEESVIGELIKVKGVGRWTAEMFLMFHLAREDVFSIGDLGLKRAIEKHYLKGKKASNHQLLTISQIWSPYRTYASMVLWRSLG